MSGNLYIAYAANFSKHEVLDCTGRSSSHVPCSLPMTPTISNINKLCPGEGHQPISFNHLAKQLLLQTLTHRKSCTRQPLQLPMVLCLAHLQRSGSPLCQADQTFKPNKKKAQKSQLPKPKNISRLGVASHLAALFGPRSVAPQCGGRGRPRRTPCAGNSPSFSYVHGCATYCVIIWFMCFNASR